MPTTGFILLQLTLKVGNFFIRKDYPFWLDFDFEDF
ncbi:Uncharacterised protein [Shewanella putrefaciens]|nr:Uncharacterised protein [Shewanella putrefaciens]